jgi:hypothetical protein
MALKKRINSKQLLKRLNDQKSDRQKITLYLSRQLYDQLKANSGEIAPSQVIEELIKEFLFDLKK